MLKMAALHEPKAPGLPTVRVKQSDDTSGSNTNTHKPIPLTVKQHGVQCTVMAGVATLTPSATSFTVLNIQAYLLPVSKHSSFRTK